MTTGLTAALDYHVVNSLGWSDLRPLQRDAVEPVRRGDDCLLLAPTAGGKTEAACFPLLSQMVDESWTGLSVLYVTPLRALLNNLHPRLSSYAAWLGRTVGLWHGDVGAGERRRLLIEPPDILLTTPESLEAMLVSTKVDHRRQFAGLRVVVVDELHAFAGDDRGWHLLSVLERLQRLAGHRVQRIGLSATVGNPAELLTWLQGGTPAPRATVVAPDSSGASLPEVTLDYVGSVDNAATVVATLHQGDKRLVFCDSRAQAESLASGLRGRGVTTFVSHSSLSAAERRRSELAFAEARDCVVVATSTLELGIDVGDLDRVIQLDAPRTVASFLQRLGRTGRRAETSRNTLFLATRDQSLLQAAGLLSLWSSGFVEPVVPPPSPRHIVAQQLLAVTLQEGRLGASTWRDWWPKAPWMAEGAEILAYLRQEGFLASDGDLLFIGDEAERRFGRRQFMDLTAVFTAEPELKVLLGRRELGSMSPLALTTKRNPGERTTLLLAGRSWVVTAVDWRRRIVNVAEDERGGRSLWQGGGASLGFELAQAMKATLLGVDPPVEVSRRSQAALERIRTTDAAQARAEGTVVVRDATASVWWTWAGTRANASLAAALEAQGLATTSSGTSVRVKASLGVDQIRAAAELLASPDAPAPALDPAALEGLKFSAALPPALAAATLAQRLSDPQSAATVAQAPIMII